MTPALNLLSPRPSDQPQRLVHIIEDSDGNSSSSSRSTESNETVRSSRSSARAAARARIASQHVSPTQASEATLGAPFLLSSPPHTTSPLPIRYASPNASSSSYTSDADSEPTSPLFGHRTSRRRSWWSDDTHRWWLLGSRPAGGRRRRRRLHRESRYGMRSLKRWMRRLIRHPFFPRHPTSILFSLLIFTVVAILITLLLMHILNPDKAPLPWRTYCTIPSAYTSPPALTLSPTDDPLTVKIPVGVDPLESSLMNNSFPPANLDYIPPSGIFLGIFTTDAAVERRMLIRSTWASQERSRAGAGDGDGGSGTSRTIVRFVLGKPRSDWARRIQLEAETYKDMVELPIAENMNSGKTHAYFTWAAENAWVPGPTFSSPRFSYSNHSVPAPPLSPHDPHTAGLVAWVRPDFVVKADDDTFVMLAELEARLRVQLDDAVRAGAGYSQEPPRRDIQNVTSPSTLHSVKDEKIYPTSQPSPLLSRDSISSAYDSRNVPSPTSDPLIYWGYLVKNRFMAGELYALSWSLVVWIAKEPMLRSMTRGKEDKQTAKWMRLHPRAEAVRWASERCWIYDHPRAGTVYSHGFLFPSEATRVRRSIIPLFRPFNKLTAPPGFSDPFPGTTNGVQPGSAGDTTTYILPSPFLQTTPSYSYSTVSQFGSYYTFPLSSLTPEQSIDALIEGSATSGLFEGGPVTTAQAWERREGRGRRYEGRRVGGTVVVHFIKRNEWYLETALALLGGEEELPRRQTERKGGT